MPKTKDNVCRCGRKCYGKICARCRYGTFRDESDKAPSLPGVPHLDADRVAVFSDVHVPWHDPEALNEACNICQMLHVKTLVIAGDLFHADTISKYIGVAKSIPISAELISCRNVLDALGLVFDRIVIIPGNHDQRLERMLGRWKDSKDGRPALELIAALLNTDPEDAEAISKNLLGHFVSSQQVEYHPLPDIVVNGEWLIQHPGSATRVAPNSQRKMVEKHRKSVIEGHNHLFGVGFDASGIDIAFNCGHLSDESKFRYVRERPSTFPQMNKGFGILYKKDNSTRLIPIALHPKWFKIKDIVEMANA